MAEFKPVHSYHAFVRIVTRSNPHIFHKEGEGFLSVLIITSANRKHTIPKDKALWRTHLDHDCEPGYNVVLFDLDSAELINCSLYEVKGVAFNFKQASNS